MPNKIIFRQKEYILLTKKSKNNRYLTNLSKEKSFKKLIDNSKSSALFDLQMRKDQEQKTLLLFIPKGITAGMTTFYSQPNPGNALASENKSRQP
jgi:predicted glycosyltransferase involved in capsule biosynthesis